jgi:hypothetical protein
VKPLWPHRLAWTIIAVLWLFIAYALVTAWRTT